MTPILAVLVLAGSGGVAAQVTPSPALSLVIPFAKGGGAEFVARTLAAALPDVLGEPVQLSLRAGEDGLAAVDAFAVAPADGRALLVASSASTISAPLANGRPPIDVASDFELVALLATVPRIVVVHPSLPVANFAELIRLAREQSGQLACGTADRLSEHAALQFERLAAIRLDCVRYDGASALRTDLLAAKRNLAFESAFIPEIRSGSLRALVIAGVSRLRALPEVPTASEAGMPGFEALVWLALLAPKGTPAARVAQLHAATDAVLRKPAVAAALESRGYTLRPMTLAQARQFLQRDLAAWRRTDRPRPSAPVRLP